MVRWARRTGNRDLLRDGYIAPKSNHNLGSTVDLTLVRLASGRELDMGTAFDAFTRRANTTRARDRVLRNRLILKNAMENQAFVNYFREWWHFDSEEPGAAAPRRADRLLRRAARSNVGRKEACRRALVRQWASPS